MTWIFNFRWHLWLEVTMEQITCVITATAVEEGKNISKAYKTWNGFEVNFVMHMLNSVWEGCMHYALNISLVFLTALLSSCAFSRNDFSTFYQVFFMEYAVLKLINTLMLIVVRCFTVCSMKHCVWHICIRVSYNEYTKQSVEKQESSRYLQARTEAIYCWERNFLWWLDKRSGYVASNKLSLNTLYEENNLGHGNLYTLENLVMILKVCFG